MEKKEEQAKPRAEPTPEMVSQVFSMMGKRGGPARAAKLSKKRRKEIAQKAAATRWANAKKKARE